MIDRDNPKVLNFNEITDVDAGRDDYHQTQYELLKSRVLARRVIEANRLLHLPEFGGLPEDALEAAHAARPVESRAMEAAIDALLARVRVLPEKNTRLVGVAVESGDAELAARLANEIARLYIEQNLEFRHETSAEAGRWLTGQVQEQRRRVEEADAALRTLREKEGLVNIEERRVLLEQRLKDLGASATALKTSALQRVALWRQMQSARDVEELPEVMNNPVVQSLRIELGALGRREAQALTRYLDEHPEVRQIRRQIAETRQRIAAEAARILQAAENDAKAAAAQEASVVAALEAAKAEALDLEHRSVQYDSRKRELDAAKVVLDSLLSRVKETDVTQELRASNIRVIDPAVVPGRPSRPDLLFDMFAGLFVGLSGGIGLAFLIDHLDSRLKSAEDVRRLLDAPLLGAIAEAEPAGGAPPSLLEMPYGAFGEGHRMVRTSLAYSWPDSGPRAILVTSAIPGEGKTVTALNLALVLAASGTRVVLVDCDLRRPQIHERLGLNRVAGLSDFLVGRSGVDALLQSVRGAALMVIPAGTPVPSPGDLLTGTALTHLVTELKRRFEWIVIDTPPVGAVADPTIAAAAVDGVVLVAAAGRAPKAAVRDALKTLRTTGARVLGVVLNRVQLQRGSYYAAYYHDQRGAADAQDAPATH
jgi:capsular exopolysaccharide synthesis family protein